MLVRLAKYLIFVDRAELLHQHGRLVASVHFVQVKYLQCPGECKEHHAGRYEEADVRVPSTQARKAHWEVSRRFANYEVCHSLGVHHVKGL
jgi:hypothetical protein